MFLNRSRLSLALAVMLLTAPCALGQRPEALSPGEWPAYGRDSGGQRYSPLAEITQANAAKLEVAWMYRTGDQAEGFASRDKRAFEATPIAVDGALYVATPTNRVVALDAATGRERWTFDPKLDSERSYSEMTCRGVSTWIDVKAKSRQRRIYVATLDARLIALDAATGRPCKDFGKGGQVDLTRGVRIRDRGDYQVTSPPAVVGDLIVVGSSIGDNRAADLERGVVRAFDARTGAERWAWDPIPTSDRDRAAATWKDGSAARTGAANAWSIISTDAERGLVFVPTSSPSPDFYGGERKGDNRYANSVTALRAATGEVVWSFQVVHHDLWDYDVASQPILFTLRRDGREIPAVAVTTKIGHLFVLHRETGEPLFPVEERPVPKSDVEGEEASPTQPFPVGLPALVPQRVTPEDAWGLTKEDCDWCRQTIAAARSEGVFTPPSLKGTIAVPGNVGGVAWSGASFDPVRQMLVVSTNRLPFLVRLVPRGTLADDRANNRLRGEYGRQEGTPYAMFRTPLMSPSRVPCIAPPWGTLQAIDLSTGKRVWEVPLGEVKTPGGTVPGSLSLGGSIVTAGGVIFIAGTLDNCLRAYDVETGVELWKYSLPAGGQATPMTYQANGRQFVVLAAGGHGKIPTPLGDWVIAFALPKAEGKKP